MVKALRYWLVATGLTKQQKQEYFLTDFGELVFQYDPYLEETITISVIHYNLACNLEQATTWYFFWNEFELLTWTKEDLVEQLIAWSKLQGENVSLRAIEDDVTCLLNTYLPSKTKISPEDNIECPLTELRLIEVADNRKKTYRKTNYLTQTLSASVFLFGLLKQAAGQNEIKLSDILYANSSIGKVFNFDTTTLIQQLYQLESLGEAKLIRTAGLDVVQITKPHQTSLQVLTDYYREAN